VGEAMTAVTPRWVVALGVRDAYGDPDRIAPGVVDRYHELLRAPGNRDGLRRLARVMDEIRREEPDWVRRIEAPTLVLWGAEDSFTPVEHARLWERDLDDAEVVILEGVGHVAHEEVAARSLAEVRRLLEAIRRRREKGRTPMEGIRPEPARGQEGAFGGPGLRDRARWALDPRVCARSPLTPRYG
jgi:pimeloyl-ACP methyl ester carboxylesterase